MANNVAQALSVLVGALSSPAVVVTQASAQAHLTATPSTSSDSNSTSRYGFVFVFTIARVETCFFRERTVVNVLPSYLKRESGSCSSKAKKAKTVQVWDRDVVCLPQSVHNKGRDGGISFPRGDYRNYLGRCGLIGKVRLTSEMTEEMVQSEIRSVFSQAMGGNTQFPFSYLQPTGGGCKSLMMPAVSSCFQWSPQQVARLAGQRGAVYILAESDLRLLNEPNVSLTWYCTAIIMVRICHVFTVPEEMN